METIVPPQGDSEHLPGKYRVVVTADCQIYGRWQVLVCSLLLTQAAERLVYGERLNQAVSRCNTTGTVATRRTFLMEPWEDTHGSYIALRQMTSCTWCPRSRWISYPLG